MLMSVTQRCYDYQVPSKVRPDVSASGRHKHLLNCSALCSLDVVDEKNASLGMHRHCDTDQHNAVQTQKDLIESMIAEDDKIEGLEHVECKVFK